VGNADYRRAVGVAERTFDYWYAEVKRTVGHEFARKQLFPAWRYFLHRNETPATAHAIVTDAAPRLKQIRAGAIGGGEKETRGLNCTTRAGSRTSGE
jgi:hypothetical protein